MAQPLHRPLLLLTESQDLEANLRRVVERPFALQRVADWSELKRRLAATPQTAICFADAMVAVGSDQGLAEGLREITRDFPLVAVVACIRLARCPVGVLSALQDWGIAEVLDYEREQSGAAVAHRLNLVKGVWAQRLFRRALPRSLSARGRALLETVAEVAVQGGSVSELGDVFGLHRATVTRWCAAAGVPEPRRMFSWTHLLLAAELLDNPERSVENAARVSGFSSAASLKSTTKSFTGLSPTELRERGAFKTIAELARSEFRAAREAARGTKHHENSWYN